MTAHCFAQRSLEQSMPQLITLCYRRANSCSPFNRGFRRLVHTDLAIVLSQRGARGLHVDGCLHPTITSPHNATSIPPSTASHPLLTDDGLCIPKAELSW